MFHLTFMGGSEVRLKEQDNIDNLVLSHSLRVKTDSYENTHCRR